MFSSLFSSIRRWLNTSPKGERCTCIQSYPLLFICDSCSETE